MNNHYSKDKYFHRSIEKRIKESLAAQPVVVLTGARQTGKSFLLKNMKNTAIKAYFSGDSYTDREALKKGGTQALITQGITVIDEVQKMSWALDNVKKAIDDTNRRKKFILTGSANLLLAKNISESLAGRASYLKLFPFTLAEYSGKNPGNVLNVLINKEVIRQPTVKVNFELNRALWVGTMPVPLLKISDKQVPEWWEGYLNTYLERDMRDVSAISDLSDYRRFMKIMAFYAGSTIEETTIARETSISQPTIHRYINLLETTNIITRLPVYHGNKKKRLIKKPKIYWFDPGIVNFLRNNLYKEIFNRENLKGFLFEHFILNHIQVWSSLQVPVAYVYFWRTVNGEEVDFIVEYAGKIAAIEVKLSSSVNYGDAAGLFKFFRYYPETVAGFIVYTGKELKQLGEKIYAVPYTSICGY